MSIEELETLKTQAEKLYNLFVNAYWLEGSRGVRPDLRDNLISTYEKFEKVNNKLPMNERINNSIKLKLS